MSPPALLWLVSCQGQWPPPQALRVPRSCSIPQARVDPLALAECLVFFALQPLRLSGPGLGLHFLHPALARDKCLGEALRVTPQQLFSPFHGASWCLATATIPGVLMCSVSSTRLRGVMQDTRRASLTPLPLPIVLPLPHPWVSPLWDSLTPGPSWPCHWPWGLGAGPCPRGPAPCPLGPRLVPPVPGGLIWK